MLNLELDRVELGAFVDVKPHNIPDLNTIPGKSSSIQM